MLERLIRNTNQKLTKSYELLVPVTMSYNTRMSFFESGWLAFFEFLSEQKLVRTFAPKKDRTSTRYTSSTHSTSIQPRNVCAEMTLFLMALKRGRVGNLVLETEVQTDVII
jgi:hypothetical protein